jgi:hypothetical protein
MNSVQVFFEKTPGEFVTSSFSAIYTDTIFQTGKKGSGRTHADSNGRASNVVEFRIRFGCRHFV